MNTLMIVDLQWNLLIGNGSTCCLMLGLKAVFALDAAIASSVFTGMLIIRLRLLDNGNRRKKRRNTRKSKHFNKDVLRQRQRVKAGKVIRREKKGNGGLLTAAGMKACKQCGSKECWECRVQQLRPQHGEGRGGLKWKKQQERREEASYKAHDKWLYSCRITTSSCPLDTWND